MINVHARKPAEHTQPARHHGLVQHSAVLRVAWLEGSSTISDSHGADSSTVSRERYEAWHLHAWAAHEATWAGWSTHVGLPSHT